MPIHVVNLHAGGPLPVRKVLQCKRWCLRAFYGVYEEKGVTEVLRTEEG
jgi:hypothetical protein